MKRTLSLIAMCFCLCSLSALDWEPVLTSVESQGTNLAVTFTLDTSSKGAKKAEVSLMDATGKTLATNKVGKSRNTDKKTTFEMKESGSYTITVTAFKDEETKQVSSTVDYRYPLFAPTVTVRNIGDDTLLMSWESVKEAQGYVVQRDDFPPVTVHDLSLTFPGLNDGEKVTFRISAIRGDEKATTTTYKTPRKEAERTWTFTEFGQSTKASLNTFSLLDSDDLSFALKSCTYDHDGTTVEKGGKFTTFHDGISYYYTTIDPRRENFTITGTFHIDYINPSADGQEGFGIVAMDSLGRDGVSMTNHYTNSASIIATKFEETIGGSKKTSKDTIGARFTTGLTPEVIQGGDAMIAEHGIKEAHAFSYDQSDLVRTGDTYTLTLTKDNTGYHAILKRAIASEDTIEEYTLYGADALSVLDSEHVYVGFAVARGCNATVSKVHFTTSLCKDDPPAKEAPPTLVPTIAKIDSPTSYSSSQYPFVYTANCDGTLTLKVHNGPYLFKNAPVLANQDFKRTLSIEKGINDYEVTFTPKLGWKPESHSVMASWNSETKRYEESYKSINTNMTVIYLEYAGTNLYAASSGSPFGDGTKADPLDLASAIAYCKPGQSVIILDPVYHLTRPVIIERGNDGTETLRKTLKAEGHSILDFSYAGGGMQLWGSYWTIENIDITKTPDNVKGLQVAGSHNIIKNVNAYENGDTGIQISGTSLESFAKWPSDNLITGCISHDNRDSAENNADGFAAKLTVAEGNVFRSCIAHHNIDDGWDLFSKIESGPIGKVSLVDCVACFNGSLSDGSGNGDGNGFKMGGDGIAVAHELVNSLAYKNNAGGVTSNSNPAIIVRSVTSVSNGGSNFSLYGKGSGERFFVVENCLSYDAPDADKVEGTLVDETNYLSNGAMTTNGKGTLDGTIFTSTDTSVLPTIVKGNVDLHGLFAQTTGAGCHF